MRIGTLQPTTFICGVKKLKGLVPQPRYVFGPPLAVRIHRIQEAKLVKGGDTWSR